jgi:hypothetical protein
MQVYLATDSQIYSLICESVAKINSSFKTKLTI